MKQCKKIQHSWSVLSCLLTCLLTSHSTSRFDTFAVTQLYCVFQHSFTSPSPTDYPMFALIYASSSAQSLLLWPHLHNNPCPGRGLSQRGHRRRGGQAGLSWGLTPGQPQLCRRWEQQQLHANQMIGDDMRGEPEQGDPVFNHRTI